MTQLHIQSNECNQQMQETVLGVADGTITDEKIIDMVFCHLTTCNECKLLYQDYFDIIDILETNESTQDDDTFTLDIEYKEHRLMPLVTSHYVLQPQVHVMDTEMPPVVEIEYPYKNEIIKVKIIYNSQAIDIVILSPLNGVKIYMLTGSRFDIATVTGNHAQFSSIQPGTIMLLFDFRKVIKINVKL